MPKPKSTADEIEAANREALKKLAVFRAAVDEHFIKPLAADLIDRVKNQKS